MNYSEIKKLDEETLEKLTEGLGPSDQCICNLLAPPDDEPKGLKASIKKVFASLGGRRRSGTGAGRGAPGVARQNSIEIPLTFSKGAKGIYTTKEVVQRKSSCGKCGCDNDKVVLKHSYANIRITSPDVSTLCPCPSGCMPDKEHLYTNNIKVTVEQVTLHVTDIEDPVEIYEVDRRSISEPNMNRPSFSRTLVEDLWKAEQSAWKNGEEHVTRPVEVKKDEVENHK